MRRRRGGRPCKDERTGRGGSSSWKLFLEFVPLSPLDGCCLLSMLLLPLSLSLSLALAETFVIGDVECDLIRIFFSRRARARWNAPTRCTLCPVDPRFLKGYGLPGFMPDAGYRWRLGRRGGIGMEDADTFTSFSSFISDYTFARGRRDEEGGKGR